MTHTLSAIKADIAALFDAYFLPPKPIDIIAISKRQPTKKIIPLLKAGHRHFGENKVQEAQEKWPALKQAKGYIAPFKAVEAIDKGLSYDIDADLKREADLFADCAVQKLKWLDEHATVFRIKRANVVDRKRKPEFAIGENGQPNILIDDYEKNIREWEAAGGIAIHHTNAADTINELAAYYA